MNHPERLLAEIPALVGELPSRMSELPAFVSDVPARVKQATRPRRRAFGPKRIVMLVLHHRNRSACDYRPSVPGWATSRPTTTATSRCGPTCSAVGHAYLTSAPLVTSAQPLLDHVGT